MDQTYTFEKTEAGTLIARLKANNEPVSEYNKEGELLYVVNWLMLPVEEYVRKIAPKFFPA